MIKKTKKYKVILFIVYFLTTILYVLFSSGVLLFTEECTFFEYTKGTLLGKYQLVFFLFLAFLSLFYY